MEPGLFATSAANQLGHVQGLMRSKAVYHFGMKTYMQAVFLGDHGEAT
jgi:hypothetical protein